MNGSSSAQQPYIASGGTQNEKTKTRKEDREGTKRTKIN